jgi:type IV pilus assembly protein PilC
MAIYSYTAVNQQGQTVRGKIEAASKDDLEKRLERLGLQLISQSAGIGLALFQAKVTQEELSQFCFYLEQLVSGGVPLIEGLSDVRDSVSNPTLRNAVSAVISEIEQGCKLSDALGQYPKLFDQIFVSLVQAGEESGELSLVLKNLGENIRWSHEITKRTKKIFIYPLFALTVILGATALLMTLVVPKLLKVLESLGQELPGYTIALINTSNFVQERGLYLLAIPVVVWLVIQIMVLAIPGIDYQTDRLKIRIPLLGVVFEKVMMSRFANIFGLLYGSGISIMEALKISQGALGNQFVSRSLDSIIEEINNGKALSAAFKDAGIFPPLVLRMVRLGETTGSLDASMRQVKLYYDKDANEAISAMQAAIGPMMMLLLAGLLAWVILAIYAPLYDAFGQI